MFYKLYLCKYIDQLDDNVVATASDYQDILNKFYKIRDEWDYDHLYWKIIHPNGKEEAGIC